MRLVYQDGKGEKKPVDVTPKKIVTYVLIAAALVVAVVLFSTCWYTVDDKQQAVVTTFGKVTEITDAGFHICAPFGIQQVHKVDVKVYQKIELGYRTVNDDEGEYTGVENESKMITGDYNIVNVEFFVEYKVSDPVKYLFSSYQPKLILQNLVQSQVRNVIGSASVDSILTDGKSEIQTKVKELIMNVLDSYDIGLILTDIKIQDSEPPTQEVIEAFKAVETAKQQAETVKNEALAYKNAKIPKAEAEADQLLQNAEYLKQNRINEAKKQVELFNAMYAEYANNPEITRSRMYYEAVMEILPDVKLIIDASEGDTQKLLPIDEFFSITSPQTDAQNKED